MSGLHDRAQARGSFGRWALVLVPGIVALGFLSGVVASSGPHNAWFAALVKPAIYPPPATFGIVWTVLYVMMGVALTMIVTAWGAPGRRAAIACFLVQLLMNLAWSPLFFAAHRIAAALALLILLDLAVITCIVLFARVRVAAAALLVPYLAWGLFATVLNWQLLIVNPAA